jgi:two-component system, chemotaxis family, chemotaxis protein CheY
MIERRPRVLVIDDAGLVRLYYRKILEAAGYDVDEALNGLEALERVLEKLPVLGDCGREYAADGWLHLSG